MQRQCPVDRGEMIGLVSDGVSGSSTFFEIDYELAADEICDRISEAVTTKEYQNENTWYKDQGPVVQTNNVVS